MYDKSGQWLVVQRARWYKLRAKRAESVAERVDLLLFAADEYADAANGPDKAYYLRLAAETRKLANGLVCECAV